MATSKSTLKRIRQNNVRRLRNRSIKSACKTAVGRIDQGLQKKDTEGANKQLSQVMSTLQKAASKGVIHHRTASRKIARIAKKVSTKLAAK